MTEINITEPALLIRVSKLFQIGMTDEELYEITQGVWKIGSNRDRAQYAFCIANMIVQEIYAIQYWQPAGTKTYTTPAMISVNNDSKWEDRWEFIGNVAPDTIRNKYIRKSVAHYFSRGSANPIKYLNISMIY